jgi:hypothetical protein
MAILNKRLFYRIGLYGIAGIIAYSLYLRANVPPETDAQYCERKGMVKIHNREPLANLNLKSFQN